MAEPAIPSDVISAAAAANPTATIDPPATALGTASDGGIVEMVINLIGKDFFEGLGLSDSTTQLLVMTVLATFAFFFFSIVYRLMCKSKSKGDAFLILGNMNAGKTTLYYKLKQGDHGDTVTSMLANEGRFVPVGVERPTPLRVVDFPGHGSLRLRLTHFLEDARGVIFLVDAADTNDQLAAEYLYSLLTAPEIVKRRVPILVVASKSDSSSAHSIKDVQARLLKSIEAMRGMQHNMADLDAAADRDRLHLGTQGEPFDWEEHPCNISFGEISVKNNELEPVLEFLSGRN